MEVLPAIRLFIYSQFITIHSFGLCNIFVLLASHQWDTKPPSAILSLSVQSIFSTSNCCLPSPFFFSLQMRNQENVLKAFNDVIQDTVLHRLSRDSGYWPGVPRIFLLTFPRGVALGTSRQQGPQHPDQGHGQLPHQPILSALSRESHLVLCFGYIQR